MTRFLNPRSLFYLILVFLLLPACVNVEEQIFLKPNGSGRMEVRYFLKRDFYQLLPGGPGSPFISTEKGVHRQFGQLEGVTVEGVDIGLDENMVNMKYILSFQDLSVFNNDNYEFSFTEDGSEKVIMKEGEVV